MLVKMFLYEVHQPIIYFKIFNKRILLKNRVWFSTDPHISGGMSLFRITTRNFET